LEHRSELVWAALTLVAAWLAAGRPTSSVRLGSYESWSDVIGGILGNAGIDGFLGNLEDFYGASDSETEALMSFLTEWWHEFGQRPVTAVELFPIAGRYMDLGAGAGPEQRRRLGVRLRNMRNTVRGGFRIVPAGQTRTNVAQYRLEQG
jgi:putative DNA primase/helicase